MAAWQFKIVRQEPPREGVQIFLSFHPLCSSDKRCLAKIHWQSADGSCPPCISAVRTIDRLRRISGPVTIAGINHQSYHAVTATGRNHRSNLPQMLPRPPSLPCRNPASDTILKSRFPSVVGPLTPFPATSYY